MDILTISRNSLSHTFPTRCNFICSRGWSSKAISHMFCIIYSSPFVQCFKNSFSSSSLVRLLLCCLYFFLFSRLYLFLNNMKKKISFSFLTWGLRFDMTATMLFSIKMIFLFEYKLFIASFCSFNLVQDVFVPQNILSSSTSGNSFGLWKVLTHCVCVYVIRRVCIQTSLSAKKKHIRKK